MATTLTTNGEPRTDMPQQRQGEQGEQGEQKKAKDKYDRPTAADPHRRAAYTEQELMKLLDGLGVERYDPSRCDNVCKPWELQWTTWRSKMTKALSELTGVAWGTIYEWLNPDRLKHVSFLLRAYNSKSLQDYAKAGPPPRPRQKTLVVAKGNSEPLIVRRPTRRHGVRPSPALTPSVTPAPDKTAANAEVAAHKDAAAPTREGLSVNEVAEAAEVQRLRDENRRLRDLVVSLNLKLESEGKYKESGR